MDELCQICNKKREHIREIPSIYTGKKLIICRDCCLDILKAFVNNIR